MRIADDLFGFIMAGISVSIMFLFFYLANFAPCEYLQWMGNAYYPVRCVNVNK